MSKNTNSIKSIKSESPKTPGGISISLLTPCRRVGLSRSWRKKGPSPFISPLSNSQRNTDEESTPQAKNSRKRKQESPVKDAQQLDDTCTPNSSENQNTQTPTRTINVIRKRSKTLLSKVTQGNACDGVEEKECEIKTDDISHKDTEQLLNTGVKISKLSRSKSISTKSKCTPKQSDSENKSKDITSTPDNIEQSNSEKKKNRSPQNLTTECVVVIQKEIFNDSNTPKVKNKFEKDPKPSQVLFDSDSDDIPLCQVNKNTKDILDNYESNETEKEKKVIDDFSKVNKISKLEDKKSSTTDLKSATKKLKLARKNSKPEVIKIESKPSSQNSFDDDDDDFDHRKTIVVKKTYDKVAKPIKAKSTGSITDKDVVELKNRIEVKKKLLLAKSLDSDTKDLRELIKKWQKGCQDALVELMELMKKKMPDQPNMENAQILEMLKIPADLVGYDSDNDCFNPPNDINIILSSLKM